MHGGFDVARQARPLDVSRKPKRISYLLFEEEIINNLHILLARHALGTAAGQQSCGLAGP
ncbi:hypothetical protein BER2_2919 [plant metagenome]|uniref:Uncharacterized protein n=1 Tax=plant metagenome TaxID=1297885 RepID=A0A484RGQ7_9ZZZZ